MPIDISDIRFIGMREPILNTLFRCGYRFNPNELWDSRYGTISEPPRVEKIT